MATISPWKKQPEDVADCVLKRAKVSKIARRLQDSLALAQFKTKHGWEDLTLDSLEPKLEEEMRRRRPVSEGDMLSDSSSSASDLPYPSSRTTLMSSPLKAPMFSDAIGSSNGSTGHRKRTYMASFDFNNTASSPSKRYRGSPTTYKSFPSNNATWKDNYQLAQSSPIKPRRQQHFTTSGGPDVSFLPQRRLTNELTSPHFASTSDDDDDLLPAHSFNAPMHSSPPRTPPMQTRSLAQGRSKDNFGAANGGKPAQEGADLLLYLSQSPSPAVKANHGMEPPSTPPPKNSKLDLPSSMMTTPGGGNLFPSTPSQVFDFADFVNITPSPAQKAWKTPVALTGRTPLSVARRRLTFDEPMP
ncbi:hypothetical protein S40288_02105 [Stachybotrys chartarum IBT 40288]|nr:hypothetical protein S40288_02105 [Stachybotrys chartarum IBT 40288]